MSHGSQVEMGVHASVTDQQWNVRTPAIRRHGDGRRHKLRPEGAAARLAPMDERAGTQAEAAV